MDDQQDVNQQADTTTATTPSGSQETAVATPEASQTSGAASDATERNVPLNVHLDVKNALKETKQTLTALQEQMQQLQTRATAQPAMPLTPEQQKQLAIKQALSPVLDQYAQERGYVSKEELDRREAEIQQKANLNQQVALLSQQYSGKDGRPKFDAEAVMDYGKAHNIFDLDAAYQMMHQAELIDFAVKQAISKQQPGIQTEASNGTGSQQTGVQDSDLDAALAKNPNDMKALQARIKRSLAATRSKS